MCLLLARFRFDFFSTKCTLLLNKVLLVCFELRDHLHWTIINHPWRHIHLWRYSCMQLFPETDGGSGGRGADRLAPTEDGLFLALTFSWSEKSSTIAQKTLATFGELNFGVGYAVIAPSGAPITSLYFVIVRFDTIVVFFWIHFPHFTIKRWITEEKWNKSEKNNDNSNTWHDFFEEGNDVTDV